MTFLKRLRDAVLTCSNEAYRDALRRAAQRVEAAVDDLYANITEGNMRNLNNTWASAQRLLDNVPAEGTPAPLAGSPEPARLAA